MSITNKYLDFVVICVLKAVMDYLNFQVPHNTGFFSITSGWWDAWHISGWLILFIIGFNLVVRSGIKWQSNVLRLGALGVIAFVVQKLLYNFLFKL